MHSDRYFAHVILSIAMAVVVAYWLEWLGLFRSSAVRAVALAAAIAAGVAWFDSARTGMWFVGRTRPQ